MPTFTPDQLVQISQQYLAGHSPSEIARRWRCPLDAINAALDATATPRRAPGGTRAVSHLPRAEMRRVIAERNARILSLHAEGKTVTEIMADVGLQRAAVCKVLRKANGPAITQVPDAEIIALARSGASVSAIVQTGVNRHRAIRVLTAAGLPITTPPKPRPPRRDLAERNAEIVRRRRAGEHPKAIAADLDMTPAAVYKALEGATDLPPLRKGPAPRQRTDTPAQPKPRPPAQRRASVRRRPEGVVTATRACHSCEILVPVNDWSDHLAKVHGYNGKAAKARTALGRYLERLRQEAPAEPQRPPDPPCPICGASPCPTPQTHGRLARARAQHHYTPRAGR